MDTTLEWTESSNTGRWVAGSLLLHVAIAGTIAAVVLLHPSNRWGENAQTAGAIQASIVSSLPLAPRQAFQKDSVLSSDETSPAPIQNKVATVAPPKTDAIPIPEKKIVKPKVAEKTAPAVIHPQPTPAPPTKAVTGETAGVDIPQVVQQVTHGTASATIQDRAFGARYAYYARLIEQKVAANWYSAQVDPHTASGKRVTITFDITRDGAPVNPRILTPSGSPTLDQSAIQAVQRTDGFGPLPAGNHLTVQYSFDYHP